MIINVYNHLSARLAFALGAVFLIVSCSKRNPSVGLDSYTANVRVNVLGVGEVQPAFSGKKRATRSDRPSNSVQSKELISFDSFDAQVSLSGFDAKSKKMNIIRQYTQYPVNGETLAFGMAQDITYRILFYKSDGTFVSSAQLTSGVPGQIELITGETYVWYALSFHNADPIPDPDPDIADVHVPSNTDLLYASGTLAIPVQSSGQPVPLDIVFAHKYSRIALELNSMGMFAGMNHVGVSISGATANTSTFNLKKGSLSKIASSPVDIDFSDFTNIEPPFEDRKIAYIYTALENPINLIVSINALDVQLDNAAHRVFNSLTANPAEFNFTFTPQLGASYSAKIDFIESPLTVNSRRWARTDLYYHGGHNPYRFLPTNAHTNARNTYFSFRGILPTGYGNSLVGGDPCALVYPEGLWRTPGFNDFALLTPVYPIETYKTVNGLGYFEYEDTQGAGAPYPSDKLRFNMNGVGTANGSVNGETMIDLVNTYGRSVHLWSNFVHDLGRGLKVYYYYGSQSGGDEIALEGINYQPGKLVETTFKNIRCVR